MKKIRHFAFFDVDDTIIKIKSMFNFYRYWCNEVLLSPEKYDDFKTKFSRMRSAGLSREKLNRAYYKELAGTRPEKLRITGAEWAAGHLASPNDLFVLPVVEHLQRLRKNGVEPVFVSGSFKELLSPIAYHLGVNEILCVSMKLNTKGFYTGEIELPQTIGPGKAAAIQTFLGRHHVSPSGCWAFGDDISDLPMLESVGHPVAVGVECELSRIAEAKGWKVVPSQPEAVLK